VDKYSRRQLIEIYLNKPMFLELDLLLSVQDRLPRMRRLIWWRKKFFNNFRILNLLL